MSRKINFLIPTASHRKSKKRAAARPRVQKVQKVQRVQRERLTGLRPEGCGRLTAAGCVRFAQRATALRAEGSGLPLRAMLIKSALRDWLYGPYSLILILLTGSLRSPPPIRAAPDFSTGKRVTRFSGRFAPLRIVFPCHPIRGTESIALCFPVETWPHG